MFSTRRGIRRLPGGIVFRLRPGASCFSLPFSSNLLIGYGAHGKKPILSLILPLAVALSFFLIADIDSPRGGIIRVHPQNLYVLAESFKTQ